MTGRIGTWHRRYRLCGDVDSQRVDTLASGQVLAAYEDALGQVFGNGPEVILIREVDAAVSINLASREGYFPAQIWGRVMATAVARTITTDASAGNVVRFPSEAAHLAAFLAALATGEPVDGWIFERFAKFHRGSVGETLRTALVDRPELVAEGVRRLFEAGKLTTVLLQLEPAVLSWLWVQGVFGRDVPSEQSLRPLLAAAITIIEVLSGSGIERTRLEQAWAAYLATPRATTDWRDRSQLTDVVAEIVLFLAERLAISWPPSSLEQTLPALDWLDLPRLADRLSGPLQEDQKDQKEQEKTPPARQRPGPTARQRLWLDALLAALRKLQKGHRGEKENSDLDRSNFRSARNALLLFSAVTAEHPDWATDGALPGFIEAVLATAASVAERGWQDDFSKQPTLLQLGEQARTLIGALIGQPAPPAAQRSSTGEPQSRPSRSDGQSMFPMASAGIFLLYRSVIDLRLGALATQCQYPPNRPTDAHQQFLAALAALWADSPPGEKPDPGVLLFAGIDPTDNKAELCSHWGEEGEDGEHSEKNNESAARYQAGLARVLHMHRLFEDPARLRLSVVPAATGRYLAVAGDEALRIWPFAACINAPEDAGPLIQRWADHWRELTGSVPTVIHPSSVPLSVETPGEIRDDIPTDLAALSLTASSGLSPRVATLAAVSNAAIRAWARWLKYIGHSSVPYLIGQLIRRPGCLIRNGTTLTVELEPRPLDIALHHSGYLEPIELPTGTLFRLIRFRAGSNG